jgi:hypothetical protein
MKTINALNKNQNTIHARNFRYNQYNHTKDLYILKKVLWLTTRSVYLKKSDVIPIASQLVQNSVFSVFVTTRLQNLSNYYSVILRLRPLKEVLVVTSQRVTWIINNTNPTLLLTYYIITNINERRSWNYINLSTGFRLCVWMRARAHPHTKNETNRALQLKLKRIYKACEPRQCTWCST